MTAIKAKGKTVTDHIREHLEKNLNLLIESESKPKYSQDDVENFFTTQWCGEFERVRKYQMVMGTFRYGKYQDSTVKFDRIGSAIERLKAYQLDGNLTRLCDVANMCMIEFDKPYHPNAHFNHEDDGVHANKIE